MQRDLNALSEGQFDILVIGGGIAGICIARDAALRGLSVALIDKGDFAAATTAASSKLIHGGLRYLQNLELSLVRESLRERRIWSNIAPHMIAPLTFLMPLYGKGIRKKLMLTLGLTAYDLLAHDRNRLVDPEKNIPAHQSLNRAQTIALEPGTETADLRGGIIFYDYQMHFPERLALACLQSACEAGAQAANYVEAHELLREGNTVIGARVRNNREPSPDFTIRARMIVNATGPWADLLMDNLLETGGEKRLIRSKGIHIITRPLTQGHAIAAQTSRGHFFILPWRDYSLIGTTDTVYRGDPDGFRVTEKDIVAFVEDINEAYPSAKLKRQDVIFFYGGLRPIVDQSSKPTNGNGDDKDSYNASRSAEIVDHEIGHSISGIITVIGGKWTTARSLAEQVVDLIVVKLASKPTACQSESIPVYGGNIGIFTQFVDKVTKEYPNLDPALLHHLAANYGSQMEKILALAEADPALYEKMDPHQPTIAAEVIYAIRDEMALTLEDVLFRRTNLGTCGALSEQTLKKVQEQMNAVLTVSDEEQHRQYERVQMHYQPSARIRAIINPRSSAGKTLKRWSELSKLLSESLDKFDAIFTDGPRAPWRLTAIALNDGVDQIIAVGGGGTINEVVNGFFDRGRPINPQAELSLISSGTGSDFRRTFALPIEQKEQIQRIVDGEARAIDIGLLSYRDDATGSIRQRYFDNVASFGLSGLVDKTVNQLSFAKHFGGKFAFQWGTLNALLRYKGQQVHLRIDDHFDEILDINTVAVCNGRYFGGGMHIAPEAKPDDGLFDVIIIRQVPLFQFIKGFPSLYKGRHLEKTRYVSLVRGRKITAEPVNPNDEMLLDVDGEAPGRLPATFEMIPRGLLLRY
ncbi:MAG: FAD-dependent oxidoreductase [Candidatus Hydrogenedentes bacterium]|nr:FAD-dependent oxidoreductase [Candidatus Hydrogenedentota bacterium]